jgi:hypothetical protein
MPDDYFRPEHVLMIRLYFPDDPRELAIRVQAARDLLPDDPALLPAAAAYLTRVLAIDLMAEHPDRRPEEACWAAEGIVNHALASRAAGVPASLASRQ